MSTSKALIYALGVAAASVLLLNALHGLPTGEQFLDGGVSMFVVAFIVMKFFVGGVKRRDGSNLG